MTLPWPMRYSSSSPGTISIGSAATCAAFLARDQSFATQLRKTLVHLATSEISDLLNQSAPRLAAAPSQIGAATVQALSDHLDYRRATGDPYRRTVPDVVKLAAAKDMDPYPLNAADGSPLFVVRDNKGRLMQAAGTGADGVARRLTFEFIASKDSKGRNAGSTRVIFF